MRTCTSRVEDLLRGRDDFMTQDMIFEDLRTETRNRINAALHHLRKRRVVDVVIEPDGTGWWYALPAVEDTRSMRQELRTPEDRPRKQRRPRIKKIPLNKEQNS